MLTHVGPRRREEASIDHEHTQEPKQDTLIKAPEQREIKVVAYGRHYEEQEEYSRKDAVPNVRTSLHHVWPTPLGLCAKYPAGRSWHPRLSAL
jgi:hypothetical protein